VKTNAARVLERLGIAFELREYEVDLEDLSAETVARKVGLPPEQVWKTLLVRGDKHGLAFAVVAGNAELDPKALARVTGDRHVEPVALKELQPLTGYVRGGVTALAAKKSFPVYLDEEAQLYDVISVSARLGAASVVMALASYWHRRMRRVDHELEREQARALRLSETRRAQAERLAIVGRLASGVAHEVNNPMAWVKANVSQLEAHVSGKAALPQAELLELLDETRQGIDRVNQIVADHVFRSRFAIDYD
jgi:Cys-tRNA(Pro)/Cys-tRNA(Cys) deacylase